MEENVNTVLDAPQEQPPKKGFVLVLAILTFIGRGLSILITLLFLVGAGFIDVLMENIPGYAEMMGGADMTTYYIVSLILQIIIVVGAAMMLKLKKAGFYVYLVARILTPVIPPLLVATLTISWLGIIIGLIWILLYGLNLKYMK